jgi:hypothetical protein
MVKVNRHNYVFPLIWVIIAQSMGTPFFSRLGIGSNDVVHAAYNAFASLVIAIFMINFHRQKKGWFATGTRSKPLFFLSFRPSIIAGSGWFGLTFVVVQIAWVFRSDYLSGVASEVAYALWTISTFCVFVYWLLGMPLLVLFKHGD